uniref:CSON013406 protein n=1 Tax=Culicoides sonorensis TaxID=179676 RepID=A0A336MC94_CULSO
MTISSGMTGLNPVPGKNSMKRSIRHELCSDAAPSRPCGSKTTRPFAIIHLVSPLAMNKSPNCASHTTKLFGLSIAYPYSNPSTASSDNIEWASSNLPPKPPFIAFNGMNISFVFWSTNIACLCEKVPRPISSPLIRTL